MSLNLGILPYFAKALLFNGLALVFQFGIFANPQLINFYLPEVEKHGKFGE
jgi:hypothetical protein